MELMHTFFQEGFRIQPQVLREIPDNNHYLDWVNACKNPDLVDKTASHFGEAGPIQ